MLQDNQDNENSSFVKKLLESRLRVRSEEEKAHLQQLIATTEVHIRNAQSAMCKARQQEVANSTRYDHLRFIG